MTQKKINGVDHEYINGRGWTPIALSDAALGVADQITDVEADRGAKVQSAKNWATTNQEFASNVQAKVPALFNRVNDLNSAVKLIEGNKGDFGPAASILGDIYNPVNAEINATAMTGLLQTLADVSTGALSEGEIKIFSQDLATSKKSPAVQLALLKRGLKLADRAMRDIRGKGQYFRENRTLEGYENAQIDAVGRVLDEMDGKGGQQEEQKISIPGLD